MMMGLLTIIVLSFLPIFISSFSITTKYLERLTSPNVALDSSSVTSERIHIDKSLTQRMFEKLSQESPAPDKVGGAGGFTSWEAFLKAEERWNELKHSKSFSFDDQLLRYNQDGIKPPYPFVTMDGASGNPKSWEKLQKIRKTLDGSSSVDDNMASLDFDIVVCGGTLGVFIATALQLKGLRICVIEAGKLKGREQEWNISMKELLDLVHLGVLSKEDIDQSVITEFPRCRSGFKNKEEPTVGTYFENGIGYECTTDDVLNLGVSPITIIQIVKQRFESLGGKVMEFTPIKGIAISESAGAAVDVGELEPVTAKLVLDCMGNASPISRQQRHGKKPDGVCCVVGTCADGFDAATNIQGDLIYTNTEIQDKGEEQGMQQYFWEAFPVSIGRGSATSTVKTTYMFTYLDANEKRPSLTSFMEDYWALLPTYQPCIKNVEEDLKVQRILFGCFPTYRDSPLKPKWSRILAVGDASGVQSPLSFGGFGALTRHLGRLTNAISEAVEWDCLHKDDLGLINDYTPNLSATWMFQKAMSVRMGQKVDPKFINRLLANNFQIMNDMGTETIKPFLQDVIRIDGLIGSLARSFVADPLFMPQIIAHVGLPTLIEWLGHVSMMGAYSVGHAAVRPMLKPLVDHLENDRERFIWRRRFEAWTYGSGGDYSL